MAKTASTGFEFRKSFYGQEHPAQQRFLIANSTTLKIGDGVRLNTAGYLVRAAAGEPTIGVLRGLVDQNGMNVFSPRASGLAGATLTPDDTLVTSSTNQSDLTRQLKADVICDPAGVCLFFNIADAALAQTNLGQMFDATNGNQINVASASDSNGQWQLVQLDPDGDGTTTKGLFRLTECQLAVGIDQGTAKITA